MPSNQEPIEQQKYYAKKNYALKTSKFSSLRRICNVSCDTLKKKIRESNLFDYFAFYDFNPFERVDLFSLVVNFRSQFTVDTDSYQIIE